jgi:hypothetical protein
MGVLRAVMFLRQLVLVLVVASVYMGRPVVVVVVVCRQAILNKQEQMVDLLEFSRSLQGAPVMVAQ